MASGISGRLNVVIRAGFISISFTNFSQKSFDNVGVPTKGLETILTTVDE